MSSSRRGFGIVAAAALTPLGDLAATRAAMRAGVVAIRENSAFDARTYPVREAAVIAGDPPADRALRFLSPLARRAVQLAETIAPRDVRAGIFVGIGAPAIDWPPLLPLFSGGEPRALARLHPLFLLGHLSNAAQAMLAERTDARIDGAVHGGERAGAEAIASALRALHAGAIDEALVLAYDSLVTCERVLSLDRVPGEAIVALRLAPAPIALDPTAAVATVDLRRAIGDVGCAEIPLAMALRHVETESW